MKVSTMGKQREGIGSLLRKACSVAVATCMALTLTPAAAWGAVASGADVSGESSFVGSSDGSATSSSEIKGIVKDDNFKFVEGVTAPGSNFESVKALEEAIKASPLEAKFNKDGLPDNFTVTWYVTEMTCDEDAKEWKPTGEHISLSTTKYENKEGVGADSAGLPTFQFPPSSGDNVDLSSLSKDKRYEFSIVLQNDDLEEGDVNKSASAKTEITIYQNYAFSFIPASDEASNPNSKISIEGYIYQDGHIFKPQVPKLNASDAASDVVSELEAKAQESSPKETVAEATQLSIGYTLANLADGVDPYTGSLDVSLPVPSGLGDVTEGSDGLAGKPVVNDANGNPTNTVNVYVYSKDGTVVKQTGALDWAKDPKNPYQVDGTTPNYLTDSKGNKVPVVVTKVEGTSFALGAFGVGVPVGLGESFTITGTAGEYGSITPAGAKIASLSAQQNFSAYAMAPGYLFTGFTLKVNGTVRNINSADEGFTSLTFYPSSYAIEDGDEVEVIANFEAQAEGAENKLTVQLKGENGAKGSVSVKATDGSADESVDMNGTKAVSIPSQKGALLTFNPRTTDPQCYVKSVEVTQGGRKGSVAVAGSTLMIGALSQATTIVVTYDQGEPPVQTSHKVNITIPESYGSQPAWIDGQTECTKTLSSGSGLTVTTDNDPDYDLAEVVVTDSKGTSETVFSKRYDDEDEKPGIYDNPSEDTLNFVAVTEMNDDSSKTAINLYNVVDDLSIELVYYPPKAIVDGSLEGGEGDWGWSTPETVKSMSDFSRGAAGAVSTYGVSTYAEGDVSYSASVRLEVGQRTQLKISPKEGYTIGEVYLGKDRVTNLLTLRAGAGEDGRDIYTLTAYRGSVSTDDVVGYDFESDGVCDKVYYASGRNLSAKITLNKLVIPAETFHTVSTSVTAFGGGSITPSQKVPKGGEATVSFFPDEGYKVQAVWIGDINVYDQDPITSFGNVAWVGSNKLTIKISNVSANVSVKVSYTAGEQAGSNSNRFNITATAGAGGSIAPAGTHQAYEGTSETFAIVPGTGYEVSTFTVNGEDKKSELSYRSTYSIPSVSRDYDIRVTFEKVDSTGSDTYTVSAVVASGEGTVSPEGPMAVAAGSNMTFTILPKYEDSGDKYYIKDVRAKYAGGSSAGVTLMTLLDGFTLELPDIQDDVVLSVTFAKADENGNYPGTTDPVPNPNDPSGSGTGGIWTPGPGNTVTVEPSENPGAVVTPSLDGMELEKDPDTNGVKGSLTFTITVADGYELDEPLIAGADKVGGILVWGGDSGEVVGDSCTAKKVADGLYTITVPGELVTDSFRIEVNTHHKSSSTEKPVMWSIESKVTGGGKITPSGIDGKVSVENGRNQTFNFIPNDGYKLHTVYVTEGDGAQSKQVNVVNNSYTIVNVRSNMKVEAVFAELDEGESQPQVKTHTVNIKKVTNNLPSDNAGGEYSPSESVEVVDGANLTISVTVLDGNKVSARLSDGTELTRVGSSFEIENITKDLTVTIVFEPDTLRNYYNLTVSSTGPGTTSPSGTQLVPAGSKQTVYFLPDSGKHLTSVIVGTEEKIADVDAATMSLDLGAISEATAVSVAYGDNPSSSRPDLPAGGSSSFPKMHSVTASVDGGVGGVVLPASAKVADNGSVALSIVPRTGYELESVTDNGKAVSGDELSEVKASGCYTVSNVSSDRNVKVTFKESNNKEIESYYTVISSVSANSTLTNNGGTISPEGATAVAGGGSFTLTLMPEPGYKVQSVIVDGNVSEFSGNSYTLFNVTEDKRIEVAFAKLASNEQGSSTLTHNIEATSSVGGSVSPEGTIKVADGKNASFTFVPNPGYVLSYVRADGNDIDAARINNNQYVFSDVTSDHSIHAVFRKAGDVTYHTVTATASANGTITPSGSTIVEEKDGDPLPSLDLKIAGFYGYKASGIKITVGADSETLGGDGASLSSLPSGTVGSVGYSWSGSTLALSGINADVEVEAYFESTYTGDPDSQPSSEFTPITGGTSSSPTGSNAGGSISIGDGGYTENPDSWDGASSDEKNPHITVVPDEGSMIDKIIISYGDGSTTVIDENGTTEYDKDGNQTSTSRTPTALGVQERGWFDYDAKKADKTGGVDFDVIFRPATDKEKQDIADGTIETPTYYEINVTYSGGGSVFSKGRVKVAKDSFVLLQMLPQEGYEVASVTLDGSDAIDQLSNTRKLRVNGDGNHSVNVVFAHVSSAFYQMVNASVVGGGGSISPEAVQVARGSSVSISLYPDEGKKVSRLIVTANGSDTSNNYDGAYSLPVYTIADIRADYDVRVYYEDDPDGTSWESPETRTLTARSGDGNGSVSPATQLVSKGSSGAIYFAPNDGYQVDYIIFNDVVTTLYGNPAHYSVTPQEGKANEAVVYFKPVTADSQSYVTVKAVTDSHATAYPQSATVKAGDSTNIYIYPDNGYTVNAVTVNGWTTSVRPAVPSGTATSSSKAYSAYVVTLDNVQPESGQDFATVNITTKSANGMQREEVKSHKLTINGQNALTLSPLGEMMVPEGMPVKVFTTAIGGHYLDSVTATEVDSSGNAIGRATDLYGRLKDGSFEYTMGLNDTEIFVKYLPVGSERPSMVNVSLGGAQFDDGNGGLTDMDLSNVSIGTAQMPDGTVVPIQLGDDGVLMSNGQPMEFKRGASYTFFASATKDGKQLLLTSATYDGVQLDVGNYDNTIYNALLNTSADLHLVFRELKDGEELVAYKRFTVTAEVVDGIGGNVTSSDVQSVVMGGISDPFVFTPNSDYWMIEKIDLYYYDDKGDEIGHDLDIDPSRYKDETFKVEGVYANTKILVTFCEASLVDVSWNNSQGYITPNPGTKYLKVPTSYDTVNFVIAPYQGCYLESVMAKVGDSDEADVTSQLIQTQSAAERLCSQGEDYSVVSIDEGAGVVLPTDDEPTAADDGTAVQATTQSGEVVAVSLSARDVSASGSLDNRNGVKPADTVFARAYEYDLALASDNALTAKFYQAKAGESSYTITATAGEHGSIEPAGAVTVVAGANQQFAITPDDGYIVNEIKIDGGSPDLTAVGADGASRTYTFTGVDKDHTIEVSFSQPKDGSALDRLVKTAAGLAKTGDLTGPVIGFFLLIAALGIGMMAISMIRGKRRPQRNR